MTNPTQDFIAYMQGLRLSAVPAATVTHAKQCLLDTLGCGLFGSRQEWSRILAAQMLAEGSSGPCTVVGTSMKVSAAAAALCNGTAVHGFELDDLIAASVVHPGACVIPAVLAAAEAVDASGERVLLGVIAGYEAMHRLGLAVGTDAAKRGFHTTGIVGPIAATIAAGVTMNLPLDTLRAAIGISCSASAGIKSFAGGSGGGMVKRYHAGRAAETGARACQLAERGFTGPSAGIEGRFGFLEVFAGATAQPHRMSESLGTSWAVGDVWVKVYPICGWIQGPVQLLQSLRGSTPLVPENIVKARIGIAAYAARNNGEVHPSDTMGAQYSIPYCSALALTADPRDPAQFALDAVRDPVRQALASRIEIFVDPEMEAVYPDHFAARVELQAKDGKTVSATAMDCHGTPVDPCTSEERLAKFRRLAGAAGSGDKVDAIIDAVQGAERLASVQDITQLLAA